MEKDDPVMLLNGLKFSHEVYDSPVPILTRVDAFMKMMDVKKEGNVSSKVTNMIKHQEDYESQGGDKLPEDFLTGLLFKSFLLRSSCLRYVLHHE